MYKIIIKTIFKIFYVLSLHWRLKCLYCYLLSLKIKYNRHKRNYRIIFIFLCNTKIILSIKNNIIFRGYLHFYFYFIIIYFFQKLIISVLWEIIFNYYIVKIFSKLLLKMDFRHYFCISHKLIIKYFKKSGSI